jgi:hypothetical protein
MLIVKEDDTYPVSFTLTDHATGLPIDLTGSTVSMAICDRSGAVTALTVTVDTDPTQGKILHTLTGTLEPGIYSGVIKLTKAGIQTTAPTADMETLKVVPTLP